ncbi:hypothetical protein K501DRAFT_253835 [Backusella circina FSU 941]|nr:hypothetical protein K501DRAFT_253835 [Backusella circina FSU 941]
MHKFSPPTASFDAVKKAFISRDKERHSNSSKDMTPENENKTSPPSQPSFSMDDLVPEAIRNIPKKSSTFSKKETTNNHIMASPESTSLSAGSKVDSFVKFESESASFEDIRSVAAKSWGNGIDLKLKKNDKKAKKSNWLSQNEFFASSKANERADSTSSGSIKSETSKENSLPTIPRFAPEPITITTTKTPHSTVANFAADKNVPSWAPDPNHLEQTPVSLPMSNRIITRSFIVPSENGKSSNCMIPFPLSNTKDAELLKLLHCILTLDDNTHFINTFHKKADTILRRAHEYSGRIFSYLLQSLVVIMESESNAQTSRLIAPKIAQSWNQLRTGCLTYIQFYIVLPKDLLIILKFLATLSVCTSLSPKDYQLPFLEQVFEAMKDVATAVEVKEINKLFQQIIHPESSLSASPQSFIQKNESIPSIPTASLIVHEALRSKNSFLEYEKQHSIPLVNVLQRMDTSPNLYNYLILHYMLLREEVMGPMRETVKFIQSLDRGEMMGTRMEKNNLFANACPKSTLLTMNSTQVAILFELASIYNEDTLMEYLTEGTLALLLPEKKHSDALFHGAIIGQIVRYAATRKGGRITSAVAIQMLESKPRIDWSGSYTLAVYKTNASAQFAVLRWLHGAITDFNKENFSSILTPRLIAADNVLTRTQISEWYGSQLEADQLLTNESQIPNYMRDVDLDISCVLIKNRTFIATPSKNNWPRHTSKWESVSPSKRQPIYTLSPSQVSALQFALTHRIAVISGPAGTGKTYLASKLIQLISAALHKGQFHQPVLLIAKSQSSLDSILTQIVPHMHDVVRFGGHPWDDSLIKKQATKYTSSSTTNPNRKNQQYMERQLLNIQAKLNALFLFRAQVLDHDPNIFCSVIPPSYAAVMRDQYVSHFIKVNYTITHHLLWNKWAPLFEENTGAKAAIKNTQWKLINDHQARAGAGLMPIMDEQAYQFRYNWVETHATNVLPIPDATQWPFPKSVKSGGDLRNELLECWRLSKLENIWHVSEDEKRKIVDALTKVLLSYIDAEINDLMDEQSKEAGDMDDTFINNCVYYGRFNKVVGMTSDFAAVHHDWVSKLWPRVVVVDEASQIHESVAMSSLLGPRVEHVVIFGNSDSSYKPRVVNEEIGGPPRNLDVSLFERWKVSGGKMIRLEEQWRMHSEVASVIDNFSGTKNSSELLITAPLTTGMDNKMDGRDGSKEILYGISQRTYYVEYQTERSDASLNPTYSSYLRTKLTNAEVDEARYVAHLAVYMTQQPYSVPQVTLLTLTVQQKYIIRKILREEIPRRTSFHSNIASIVVDTVEQNAGRENSFVIISTATPGKSSSYINHVPFALTRARYGLVVVGKPGVDKVHARWRDFAEYMKKRELYGSALQITCYTHAESAMMSYWTDFMQMKNGGCSQPCLSLMPCGHLCPEVCHFLSHDHVTCSEPCIRMRPPNCTHTCPNKCSECTKAGSCPPCNNKNTIILTCGHKYIDTCSLLQNVKLIQCHELVDIVLPCGHTKSVECFQSSKPKKIECGVSSTVVLACGHSAEAKCGVTPICVARCIKEIEECGHSCKRMVREKPWSMMCNKGVSFLFFSFFFFF